MLRPRPLRRNPHGHEHGDEGDTEDTSSAPSRSRPRGRELPPIRPVGRAPAPGGEGDGAPGQTDEKPAGDADDGHDGPFQHHGRGAVAGATRPPRTKPELLDALGATEMLKAR